jgi:ribosomal protein S6
MKKYTLTGEYTIVYVKEETIEACTHEEALERFDKILQNTNAKDCSANNMGWEITDCEIQN